MENRNFKAAASASPPTAPVTPSNGYPTDGNPSTGTPATLPGAFWFHKIGEEMRAVITGFGLTPADAALNQVFLAIQAGIAATIGLPMGYKSGVTLANNSTSAIDFSAGVRRSSANAFDMSLASTLTKNLQSSGSWTAGSAQNGLFTGAKATSTWYHCFVIRKTSDGTIDAGFDTSITAANIPAGYGAYRRVGSIRTDGSGNIMPFSQFDNRFLFQTPPLDMYNVAVPTSATNYTITTPPGVKCLAKIWPSIVGNLSAIYIRDPDAPALAVAPSMGATGNANMAIYTGVTNDSLTAELNIMTNVSSQINIINDGGCNVYLLTHGWTDYGL